MNIYFSIFRECNLQRAQIEGRLAKSWADRFEVMQITTRKRADQSVVTCLIGRVMDQSKLIGMLDFLAEMHMPILGVRCSFYYQNLFEVFFVRAITFNV
jgi:hypothetical protein